MRFQAKVESSNDGRYLASCQEQQCTGRGPSAAAALEALREEIRYRLELCPCSGMKENLVELEVVSQR